MAHRPAKINSQIVEKNIKLARELDHQRHELASFAAENAKLLSAASAQEKVEVRRRQAQQDACKSEQQYEDRVRQEQYNARLRERTIVQNNALANELNVQVSEEERRSREIQRICEESPELKELERALKTAYLNKERAAQYEEKILLAAREQERIQAMEEQMEYNRINGLKADAEKEEAKKAIYKQQRVVLQRQIEERREQLAEAQRQTEVDRAMVDDIVERISREDEADFRKKREMQHATATMMRAYEQQRRRELAQVRAEEKAEEERIMAYNRSMDARLEGLAAKKQAKKDEEDRILQQIVEETERKRREEEEFNSLRDMLWEEELEAKRSQEVQQRKDKQRQMKQEMMEANSQMLQTKALMRQREAENEARMVTLMRRKFAEDEAKERNEEEARRNSKLQHMSLIEKQRLDKKSMYDQERFQEMSEAEDSRKREEYRKRVIQEARKRLLEEHATKLRGYMPGGAFANETEMEIFKRASVPEI